MPSPAVVAANRAYNKGIGGISTNENCIAGQRGEMFDSPLNLPRRSHLPKRRKSTSEGSHLKASHFAPRRQKSKSMSQALAPHAPVHHDPDQAHNRYNISQIPVAPRMIPRDAGNIITGHASDGPRSMASTDHTRTPRFNYGSKPPLAEHDQILNDISFAAIPVPRRSSQPVPEISPCTPVRKPLHKAKSSATPFHITSPQSYHVEDDINRARDEFMANFQKGSGRMRVKPSMMFTAFKRRQPQQENADPQLAVAQSSSPACKEANRSNRPSIAEKPTQIPLTARKTSDGNRSITLLKNRIKNAFRKPSIIQPVELPVQQVEAKRQHYGSNGRLSSSTQSSYRPVVSQAVALPVMTPLSNRSAISRAPRQPSTARTEASIATGKSRVTSWTDSAIPDSMRSHDQKRLTIIDEGDLNLDPAHLSSRVSSGATAGSSTVTEKFPDFYDIAAGMKRPMSPEVQATSCHHTTTDPIAAKHPERPPQSARDSLPSQNNKAEPIASSGQGRFGRPTVRAITPEPRKSSSGSVIRVWGRPSGQHADRSDCITATSEIITSSPSPRPLKQPAIPRRRNKLRKPSPTQKQNPKPTDEQVATLRASTISPSIYSASGSKTSIAHPAAEEPTTAITVDGTAIVMPSVQVVRKSVGSPERRPTDDTLHQPKTSRDWRAWITKAVSNLPSSSPSDFALNTEFTHEAKSGSSLHTREPAQIGDESYGFRVGKSVAQSIDRKELLDRATYDSQEQNTQEDEKPRLLRSKARKPRVHPRPSLDVFLQTSIAASARASVVTISKQPDSDPCSSVSALDSRPDGRPERDHTSKEKRRRPSAGLDETRPSGKLQRDQDPVDSRPSSRMNDRFPHIDTGRPASRTRKVTPPVRPASRQKQERTLDTIRQKAGSSSVEKDETISTTTHEPTVTTGSISKATCIPPPPPLPPSNLRRPQSASIITARAPGHSTNTGIPALNRPLGSMIPIPSPLHTNIPRSQTPLSSTATQSIASMAAAARQNLRRPNSALAIRPRRLAHRASDLNRSTDDDRAPDIGPSQLIKTMQPSPNLLPLKPTINKQASSSASPSPYKENSSPLRSSLISTPTAKKPVLPQASPIGADGHVGSSGVGGQHTCLDGGSPGQRMAEQWLHARKWRQDLIMSPEESPERDRDRSSPFVGAFL